MDRLLSKLIQKMQDGTAAELVTVIQSSGSTPRGAGAQMLVFADGGFEGTVGGGTVEYEAQRLAQECISTQRSCIQDYYLHPNDAADLGMICGGDVTLLFQYLAPSDDLADFLTYVVDQSKSGQELWVVTAFSPDETWSMCAVDQTGQVSKSIGDALFSGLDPDMLTVRSELSTEDPVLFYQPLNVSGHVFIFGAGHISHQLLPMLDTVFFPCTVIDDSDEYANQERFPLASTIMVTEFGDAFDKITVTPRDYIVILTRGHVFDYVVLAQALKTQAYYVGMIGSRTKRDAIYQKLILDDGFTVTDIHRVHSPIGLSIGGETPEEIALSIAAELVQERAKL